MYKNYIFDLYGTLIDISTDEDSTMLWDKLSLFYSFKGASYTPNELKNLYKQIIKEKLESVNHTEYPDYPIEIVFSNLYILKGVTPSEDLINDTAHLFRILSIKYIRLYEGVIELLELLKSKGKKIYLLSNAQKIFTLFEMKSLSIYDYFDDILFSSDYKTCKPDTNFYDELINRHSLNKEDCIMIGNDYICDIKGATDAGIDSFYIHSNLSPEVKSKLTSTYSVMEMDISKLSNTIVR